MYCWAGQRLPGRLQTPVAGSVQAMFTIPSGNLSAAFNTPFPLLSGFVSPSILRTLISLTCPAPYKDKTTYASSTASFITLVNPSDPDAAGETCQGVSTQSAERI